MILVAGCAPSGQHSAEEDQIGEVFDHLRGGGFSGVIALATADGVEVDAMGYADREAEIMNGPDVVYDVGSLTKQFTAAAILRLTELGALAVEDPVARYLPELAGPVGRATLHELLTHTAGLVDALGDDYDPIELDEYLALVDRTPLLAEPGVLYSYSNVGYSLLAAVIEVVSGTSYESFLARELFAPAGMTATGYVLPDWSERVLAIGYRGDQRVGIPTELGWGDDGPFWHLRGNGGLLSSVNDLLAWHEALLGPAILSETSKQRLYGRHVPEGPGEQTFYGYGWSIVPTPAGTDLITHDGGNGVFFADFLRFVEDGVTVVVLTNATEPRFETVAYDLADAVFEGPVAGVRCGADDLAGFELLADPPPGGSGDVIREFLDLMRSTGGASDQGFVVDHVGEGLSAGRSTEELVAELQAVRHELSGFELSSVARETDALLHLEMANGPQRAVVTFEFDEDDRNRLECFGVSR